jgi:thioredoxin-related protein
VNQRGNKPVRKSSLLQGGRAPWALIILCALAWMLPACAAKPSPSPGQAGTRWLDYDTVMGMGARNDKPIMLYFRAKWCYFCQEMEQRVFPKPSVDQALKSDLLPVRLDVARHKRLAEIYHVKHLPTTLILDKHGREVLRSTGYMSEGRLLAAFEYVKSGRYRQVDFKTYLRERI